MKQTRIIMGMPITVEISGEEKVAPYKTIFEYFESVDIRFSPFKPESELLQVNNGLPQIRWSNDMKEVMELCEQTREITGGYFNVHFNGTIDTSGLVKGWSIDRAASMLKSKGYDNFYIEAGGDIQAEGEKWRIGIRNPFNIDEIVKIVDISGGGIATSGRYIRGDHIYNPVNNSLPQGVSSITVIGPDIFEADRFATAAYAMGKAGVSFINSLPGLEAYMIDDSGIATFTQGFADYVA